MQKSTPRRLTWDRPQPHLKAELASLRIQHQQLRGHADAMADALEEVYTTRSGRDGSPLYGIKAMAVSYRQFLDDHGFKHQQADKS